MNIWCQDDEITAYIDGTEIYRIELRVNNNELNNFYCSCPYSEDGHYMCKHIAAVLYRLKENDVPELETSNDKKVKNKFQLSKIYDEMNYGLRKISDRNGFVNYYNGRYFVGLISNISEWKSIKKTIIPKIKPNNIHFLEKIYVEENEIDRLFELLKKNFSLSLLAEYQDILKSKYNNELLEFYKPQIIESSKMVSDRNAYYGLCRYIGIMKELNNSDDFIFDMLKEMYPNYKSKRAFKEEIANVLSSKNKQRFYELINN